MTLLLRKPFIFIVLIMVVFLIMLFQLRSHSNSTNQVLLTSAKQNEINGFLLPKPLALAEVNFTATEQTWQSTAGFNEQWTLLALGYTQCPDVCPTTLFKLDQVIANIPEAKRPKVAFLSIDITPDNIDTLKRYMNYFNKTFVGLSSRRSELDKFFKSLGAHYAINKNDKNGLDIEHSSAIFLISPEQEYVANFPYMLNATQISDDYLSIINHY